MTRVRAGVMAAVMLGAACSGGEKGTSATRAASDTTARAAAACPGDNGGITLPAGFCATVYADSVGAARHVTVAPDGRVFVAIQTGMPGEAGATARGAVLALRDTNGDGRADVRQSFGQTGGTGVALYKNYLYADATTRIVRYPMAAGAMQPSGAPETIVSGLPTQGHAARNFAIDSAGAMYVNFGSGTNACQQKDRQAGSPGIDPCVELQKRAGIWRFAADKTGQTPSVSARFATGIRNAVGLAMAPDGKTVYATQHGRDQLSQNWPKFFTDSQSAELPAEELIQPTQGDDFGWPYCFYDEFQKKLVTAPEYGGDGKQTSRCAGKKPPLVAFPGHWAPDGLAFYTGTQFPEHYRGGAFIAFHGSWNRLPMPQAGYKVVFVPFANGRPTGQYETFADGFAGATVQPDRAAHRPVGLAQMPDGSLLITDDKGGRIWRVTYGAGKR